MQVSIRKSLFEILMDSYYTKPMTWIFICRAVRIKICNGFRAFRKSNIADTNGGYIQLWKSFYKICLLKTLL